MYKTIVRGIRDYGLFDRIYALAEHNQKKKEIGDPRYTIIDYCGIEESPLTWVCFLPWRISFEEAVEWNLLPTKGRIIVYEGPIGVVHPNPATAKKLMLELVSHLKTLNLNKFNVLGLSVGNYPALYVASEFDNVEKLVCVVPGHKLGACLWNGCSTPIVRKLAEKLGMESHKDYDKVIGDTNPSKKIHLLPEDIEIHIASHDAIILTKYAYKLLEMLEACGIKANVTRYEGRGHVFTLWQYGMDQKY